MVQGEYLRVNRQAIRIDVRLRGESSTCCGVNLAFAALRVWCVSFAELVRHFRQAVHSSLKQGRLLSKWVRAITFGQIEERLALTFGSGGGSATCCGVNLASAALRVWCVLRVRCFSFAQLFGIFSAGCDPVCFQGTEFLRL
jgi:hypothetical protein